ncbi:DEAD/DEAH box helicase family protein [Streptomyces sp. OUCMDZ-4982]|nr:DEAD/DEAH box helicase family protein [Streptomyces sp. OUCMDZ-4982]MCR8945062.1 DEAD/DEAH box helicase family protein [Streptomyces sp. OUCMDZ-4982]
MLQYEDREPGDDGVRARALAAAMDQWRDSTGEPFDWTSEGLLDRLRSPYGRGMLDQARGRNPETRWDSTAPADAKVWETDDGAKYTYDSGLDTVAVYDPDGLLIARGERKEDPKTRKRALLGEMRDGRHISGEWEWHFVENAVWQHRIAQMEPADRDTLWIYYRDHRPIVHGTDKSADDWPAMKALLRKSGFTYSSFAQAYVTAGTTRAVARAQSVDRLARALYAQGRMVEIRADEDRLRGVLAPAAPAPAAARAAVLGPAVAPEVPAAPTAPTSAVEPAPEPEPVDLTGLTDEELLVAQKATIHNQDHRREIGRRGLERAAGAPPAELSDEDLGAELEWWERALYKTSFHSSDENYRTLERRKGAVVAERNGRTARSLLAGPVAAELDDDALESAYERMGKAWLRLPGGTELSDEVTAYRAALKEERVVRRVRSYGERTPVGEMTLEELTAESTDLRSHAKTHAEQSEFSYREEIKKAQEERLKAVEEAWHQRGLEQHPDAARARLGTGRGRQPVRIDGARDAYGYVERQGKKFRALADYSERGSLGDFDSAPAAMAALVRRFDQDPETLPQRTWGLRQNVDLVSSSYEPLVSWLRRRPSLSREQDRLLTELTPYQMPTQTKVIHPLTNKAARAYPFYFEEGLLGELARVAERTTEDLREQSLNGELPKREREAAKRRIPAMGAALIRINAVIEDVREAGGDVERRGVDQGRVAAQLSALAGSVDGGEGGEGDGGEQPVRDAAAEALGGVPAPGAGGDGEPGEVLPDAGVADGRGDRRGGGGPGGDAGTGDGVPGPGRADAADPGDGAGAGPARDAAATGGRPGPGGTAESGRGGAGVDPQGAGEPGAVVRFRPDPADLPRGPMARAEANLAALKVLRTVEGEKRGATLEEKRTLARWSGWGSVPTVFLDEPDADEPLYQPGGDREGGFETDHAQWESYSQVRGELRDLLDPFEWRAASRAVLSAHYTPQAVAEAMWEGLGAYGFKGGEVLEAGCGSGAFFGVAPKGARLTGVELDTTTAAIAARIYPHANVLPESFTDTDAPLGTFDAVIGNVPFAQAPFGERRYRAGGHSLHNGFIIKQLALLRPGAYMSVITSRWTLDGEDSSARQDMSRWGDLAAAYRLPKGTFGETADTDVVADVLVFRRRAEGEEPGDLGWIDAPERELGGHRVGVNAYFTQHPDHVLGRLTAESGPYGPRVTVQGDPSQAPRLLRERMQTTAAAAVAAGRDYIPHEDWPHREPLLLQTARAKHATDFTGRLYTDDQQRIWQHVNGADPVRAIAADGVAGTEQLRMLLSLRDVAGELQELDRTSDDPARAGEVRGQLARLHAVYTEKYGPLSRPRQTRLALPSDEAKAAARKAEVDLDGEERLPTGWGWFRQDPHAAVVLGLEHWDRASERAVPSEVLVRRPGTLRGELKPTSDPKAALMAVMGATGRVDLPMIANLLGTTTDDARLRLGTEVFDNPVTGKLEHAGAYLSGAVRTKLEQARTAAATDPAYAVNVAALEVAQPAQKLLGQFTAKLGAHWIPAPLVQGFLREYLGDPTLQVSHNERYGWSLAAGKVPDAVNALKGTARRPALHIAKALLGRASMAVNLLDGSGVDEDATRAMRYKADAMRSAFEEYCTASTIRVTQLTDAYNRQMNGHRVRSYDGLSPTLEGFTTERTPHPWQHSGAARMQFERGVILAHEMGLGKTTTMVMGSQALKASGQIAKPFVVVQPGLGKQWLDEAQLLYPNADIRLITSDDLADGNRRPVLEWLRANTPDLVIFTEGAFGSIRMSPERQELFIFRELESLKEQLERERGIPHNAFALMKLEQRLATVEARIRRNDAPMRTPGEVYWDDLGFDYVMVDEAHRFTALGFRSKEAGGSSASIRAVDLYQKVDWHHQVAEADGGRPTVTLGTGTPMENSIAEQYDCLELATPWLLDQFGVHGPDLWAETYGETVQRIEMAPDGSGLTIVERFSRFTSKQTMKTMWGLATDTKTGDEVGIERPQIAGGAPQLVLVDPTPDQQARLQRLVVRGQAIHAGDVTRDEDNMLAVSGEGRAVALDPRLVDATAPAGNKLVQAADIIAAGYHANKDRTYPGHPDPGGLFFVFANSGTPGGNNKGDFDAYAELRELLVTRGVPREMVQFAQEHRSPEQKAAMTKAANTGGIAVLMGSSEVLGTGFNGQTRAYALMHLDQDWTPAMMMQRNARALRPGNQHKEVDIYFLATKGSMDAWQVGLLTSKAEGLRDIQRPPGEGDDDGDTVEEIGASDWDYATMAAEIGGNPYMRDFMEAKLHLQGLEADRRNAAADRVRQTELLGIKEGELSATRQAIAAREKALPKITDTIRGDDFRIRIGGLDYDRFGEAAPALRRAVTDAVRAHQNQGRSPWKVLGTFGGLDFAVQPEIAFGSGEISAYIGFPELRHSESMCSMEDLLKANIGSTMLGRLATALEKAEDHQLMDHERLPGLEREVTVLTAQREAVNYGPAIEHARRRVELLDGIIGTITERDKVPELTESMLDPNRYTTERSRKKALREQAEKRAPLQAAVDAAAAELTAFDENNPAPEPVQLVDEWTENNDTPEAGLGASPSVQADSPEMELNQAIGTWMDDSVEEDARRHSARRQKAEPASGPGVPGTGAQEPAVGATEPSEGVEAPPAPAAEPSAGAGEDITTLFAPGEQVRVTPMSYDTWSKTYVPQPEFVGTVVGYTRNGNYRVAEPEHGTSNRHYDARRELHKLDPQPSAHTGSAPTIDQSPASAGPGRTPTTSPALPAPASTADGGTGHDAGDDGDGYGTADFYQDHGIPLPPRVAPKPPEPEAEPEPEEGTGVSDDQITVDDVRQELDPAGQEAARSSGTGWVRLVSDDGKLTFTLLEVPAGAGLAETAVEGYQRTYREFSAVVDEKNAQVAQSPAERADQLARWRRTYKGDNHLEPFRPLPALKLTKKQDAPGLTPPEYGIGSWVTWRDGLNGPQVTGQVTGPGPAGNTWFVSTDRSGHTGEFHVLSRAGKQSTGYTYSLNGRAVDLRPADGPGPQQLLEDLPEVDAVPAPLITSYADWVPTDGLAWVREPIPVLVGETGPRLDPEEVAFDVIADGIPFVVQVGQRAGTPVYLPRIDAGDKAITFPWADTRGAAVAFCVQVAREAKEMAAEPLEAKHRKRDLALADDGVCERCSRHRDDDTVKELYRVDGGDADCIDHVVSRFEALKADVARLAQARRIWATRTAPEPQAADSAPPADAEQPDQAAAEAQTAPHAGPPAGDPREVARQSLQGGNRITTVVSGRSIEWDGEAWGLPVPETVNVTGTVYPGHRAYRQYTRLLDAVLQDEQGQDIAAPDSVHIRLLPDQVLLVPAEHRDDLRPEPRTVRQIRLGDLIAEGGARGEVVTELRLADPSRRGSAMTFSTRDVATDEPNGFALSFTDEILVVPRERRAPHHVAAVFGLHHSHHQVVESAARRTRELHTAVAEAASHAWPQGTGPQDHIRALDTAITAITVAGPRADAYRQAATATEAAAAAAGALLDATDDGALNDNVGKPLNQLRQHLDTQTHQLRNTAAHLDERAAAQTSTVTAPQPPSEPVQQAERAPEADLPAKEAERAAAVYAPERKLAALRAIDQGRVRWSSRTRLYSVGKDTDASTRDIDWACGIGLAGHVEHGRGYRVDLTTLGRGWLTALAERVRPADSVEQRPEGPATTAPSPSDAPAVSDQYTIEQPVLSGDSTESGTDKPLEQLLQEAVDDLLEKASTGSTEESTAGAEEDGPYEGEGSEAGAVPHPRAKAEPPSVPASRTEEADTDVHGGTEEAGQLGLFNTQTSAPELAAHQLGTAEGGREAQLQAALTEGETIAPVSFTDQREPAAGWILTTAAGHTFRLRPLPNSPLDADEWEAGHDADGSYWWNTNLEDRPLEAVLARVREDTATRTRFASLWARYGHLTEQPPQFGTTTDRVQLEEGVFLIRRFGRVGLIASCQWGWEHLTDSDGAQGHTGGDWSRKGPDNRQYVAEWKIWNLAQKAVPTARLRVVAQLTDDMADTPDAYCDASAPYVGKCSAKRSGARYTVAVDDDQGSELGCYTVCARCLSHRLLTEDGHFEYSDVETLVGALAKGDPKVVDLHWKQWPDRAAELAGQMLSTALDAGETAPWPAQALTSQILTEACEAGDDRAMREARAAVKAAGGNAKAQKRAADKALTGRQDRAALITRRGAAHTDTADEADDRVALAILERAGLNAKDSNTNTAPEPADQAPEAVDVETLTVNPQVHNGEPSSYEFNVTGPGLTVGEYTISHDAQGKGARGIVWRATWHGVEPSGRWEVISIGSGEGKSAALAAVAEHAARAGGDLAAGFTVARRMRYDAGLWVLPEVGESEAIQYHPDGSWTITAETGAQYTVRREWRGRDATNDLAPLLIEDQAGTLVASCTAVDGYMSAWAPMLDRLRLHARAVADGVTHATAVTPGGGSTSWVEAWCVCSWTERTDVAAYADRVPAGEALALAHRQEGSTPAEAPAAAELPELNVVLLDVDVPLLGPAEPYATDGEVQADIDRLAEAFTQWSDLPAVQQYDEADRQQRPDGSGNPTNPVAQLGQAYTDAARILRTGPAGSADDVVREVHRVAAWSEALDPIVGEDLRGPLEQVRTAAMLLAARSQATVEAFENELAALAASPEKATTAARTDPASTQADTATPDTPEPTAESAAPDQDAPDSALDQQVPAGPAAEQETAELSEPAPDLNQPAAPAPEPSREPDTDAATRGQTLTAEPLTEPGAQEAAAPQSPSVPTREPNEVPHQEDAVANERNPESDLADPPTATDPTDQEPDGEWGEVEDPPTPQSYTEVFPLAADDAYELHLTGLDGQGPSTGELRYGPATIAAVRMSASGTWYARLTADGVSADVTTLSDSPQGAADEAATMFAVFTSTPYGPPPGAAPGEGTQQRVEALRSELREAAVRHRDAVTGAASRAYANVEQNEHLRQLVGSLDNLAAAVPGAHGSRQMAASLDAVQQAVNAWGGTLPADPALDERQHMASPLAHLLYDTMRLHARLRATLTAVEAERAAAETARAKPAPGEPSPQVQSEQASTPPAPAALPDPVHAATGPAETPKDPEMATPAREGVSQEAQRSAGEAPPPPRPTVTILLRKGKGQGLSARAMTPHAALTKSILPSPFRRGPLPPLSLPVTVEVPMPTLAEAHADGLLRGAEMDRWLGEQLEGGPMGPAWNVREVRLALGDLTLDTMREEMAPTVEEIADWLANAAAEDGDLHHAAHRAPDLSGFTQQFARTADDLITRDGTAIQRWSYFEQASDRRNAVLAVAAPDAYERLLAKERPRQDAPDPYSARDAVEGELTQAREKPGATADKTSAHQPPEPEAEADAPAAPEIPPTEEPVWAASGDAEVEAEPTSPAPGELPLSTTPLNEDRIDDAAARDPNTVAEFEDVKAAWDERVPTDRGTSEDLYAEVKADLASLHRLLSDAADAWGPPPPAPASSALADTPVAEAADSKREPHVGQPDPTSAQRPVPDREPLRATTPEETGPAGEAQEEAAAVNTALRQADEHAPGLQDLPEWQRIQTLRGAFGNLMNVMKTRAGEHFDKLMADRRVSDFIRRASLRVCEKIAGWAQASAQRLRRADEHGAERREAVPSAEALERLADASREYCGARPGAHALPRIAGGAPDVSTVAGLREMGEALARPMPGSAKRVSAAAARGRSTTTGKKTGKGPAKPAEQAGHLRRRAEQHQASKPSQQR